MGKISARKLKKAISAFQVELDKEMARNSKKSRSEFKRKPGLKSGDTLSLMQVERRKTDDKDEYHGDYERVADNRRVANIDDIGRRTLILEYFFDKEDLTPLEASLALCSLARSSYLEHMRIRMFEASKDYTKMSKHAFTKLESAKYVKALKSHADPIEAIIQEELENRRKTYGKQTKLYKPDQLKVVVGAWNNFFRELIGAIESIGAIPVENGWLQSAAGLIGWNTGGAKNDATMETKELFEKYWNDFRSNRLKELEFLMLLNHGLIRLFYYCTLKNTFSEEAKHEKMLRKRISKIEEEIIEKLAPLYKKHRKDIEKEYREEASSDDESEHGKSKKSSKKKQGDGSDSSDESDDSSLDSDDDKKAKAKRAKAKSVAGAAKKKGEKSKKAPERKKGGAGLDSSSASSSAAASSDSSDDESDSESDKKKGGALSSTESDSGEVASKKKSKPKPRRSDTSVSRNRNATFALASSDSDDDVKSSKKKKQAPIFDDEDSEKSVAHSV